MTIGGDLSFRSYRGDIACYACYITSYDQSSATKIVLKLARFKVFLFKLDFVITELYTSLFTKQVAKITKQTSTVI